MSRKINGWQDIKPGRGNINRAEFRKMALRLEKIFETIIPDECELQKEVKQMLNKMMKMHDKGIKDRHE